MTLLKITTVFLSSALIIFQGSAIAGGDVAAGKAKTAVCGACHGAAGISANPMWPNLAGQKAAYTKKQLAAFKAGTRKDPMMSPQAMGLSDADMDNIAAYYASIK